MPELTDEELQQKAYEQIWNFSTSIFAGGLDDRVEFRGSGTFVAVEEKRCLLTAGHVWDQLSRMPHPDVAFGIRNRRAAVTVRREALRCLHCSPRPKPDWDEWGPDLALIEINGVDWRRLEDAGKTFYDLIPRRTEALSGPVNPGSGMWLIVGSLLETVEQHGRQPDGGVLASLDAVALGSTVHSMPTHGGLDYVDLSLYDKRTANFPDTYWGLSGGGLWRLGRFEGKMLVWDGKAPFLEGVVFWHASAPPAKAQDEVIRCHGRVSLYDHLLTASAAGR